MSHTNDINANFYGPAPIFSPETQGLFVSDPNALSFYAHTVAIEHFKKIGGDGKSLMAIVSYGTISLTDRPEGGFVLRGGGRYPDKVMPPPSDNYLWLTGEELERDYEPTSKRKRPVTSIFYEDPFLKSDDFLSLPASMAMIESPEAKIPGEPASSVITLTDQFLWEWFGMPDPMYEASYKYAITPYLNKQDYERDMRLLREHNNSANPQTKFLMICAAKIERTAGHIKGY